MGGAGEAVARLWILRQGSLNQLAQGSIRGLQRAGLPFHAAFYGPGFQPDAHAFAQRDHQQAKHHKGYEDLKQRDPSWHTVR